MSRLPIEIKEQAINLRKRGYSLREIVRILNIGQGTASVWLRDIILSDKAKTRLLSRIKKGQYVAAENKKAKTAAINSELFNAAKNQITRIKLDKNVGQLMCSMIYWCEGCKDDNQVQFTNSDPKLAKLFMDLLEKYFGVSRKKFRVSLHIHEYHNYSKQLKFWLEKLNISKEQFHKPYLKPNTGKRIRDNYPGCASIRYYDTMLARKLLTLAKAYLGA